MHEERTNKNSYETDDALNHAWNGTCKVVFGNEIGELSRYSEWLGKHKQPKLVMGGMTFPSTDYENCKRVTDARIDAPRQMIMPLSIDDVKDIDSIIDAIREQICYAGNTVFGNSGFIKNSAAVSDSFYVLDSARITDSKNVAYSTIVKTCNNIFGCNVASIGSHAIRCHQFGRGSRNFEACLSWLSSDCYYTYNMVGCNDCMFSFNLKGKTNRIGNLELPKEKYREVKKRLVEQLASILEQKKKAPTLVDIINEASKRQVENEFKPEPRVSSNADATTTIEKTFKSTTRILFGKQLTGIRNYAPWLTRRIIEVNTIENRHEQQLFIPGYANFNALSKARFISIGDAEQLADGKRFQLTVGEVERLSIENAGEAMASIVLLSAGFRDGNISNVAESPIVLSSTNCLRVLGCVNLKNSAYCTWPNGSDHVFGSAFLFNSSFSMKCYNSFSLTRCFETDSSSSSSDLLFSHNCENVHDSMFCFNAKNLRNAIGNAQLPAEAYQKLKRTIQSQIYDELESKKCLKLDIFSIPDAKPLYSGTNDI